MLTLIVLALVAAAVVAFVAWRYRPEIGGSGARLWDFVIRFRTWIIVGAGELLLVIPDLLTELNADPDFAALVPEHWRHWIAVVILLLTLWSRFRPATRAADPEVKVAKALKDIEAPAAVVVREAGAEPVHVATVVPK